MTLDVNLVFETLSDFLETTGDLFPQERLAYLIVRNAAAVTHDEESFFEELQGQLNKQAPEIAEKVWQLMNLEGWIQ